MSLLPKPFDLQWPLTEDQVANLEIMLQELYRDLGDGVLYPVTVPKGGTNIVEYVVGDLLYASASTVLSRLADVATGNVLLSGGVGVAPLWGKVGLTTHISGILPVANGGTNIASYTIGDLLYASAAGILSKLADVSAGSYLRSGGVGTAPLWSTLKLPNAGTIGDLPHVSSADTVTMLAAGTAAQVLTSNGAGVAPSWQAASGGSGGITGLLTNGDALNPELMWDSFGDVVTT